MAKLVVTIDGPAASGKSTVARMLADELGAVFLDTGAMYRAVTLAAMQADIDLNDEDELLKVLANTTFDFKPYQDGMKTFVDDIDVTEQIRQAQVTTNARYIASAPKVRVELVKMQQQFVSKQQKVVTEGRDQGTVAFADADIKFYLTADVEERAKRRLAELKNNDSITLEQLKQNIEKRDARDSQRSIGPLKQAEDAIVIDTTNLSVKEVVQKLLGYVMGKCC